MVSSISKYLYCPNRPQKKTPFLAGGFFSLYIE